MKRAAAILAVTCLVSAAPFGSSSRAQMPPRSSNVKCRNHIGSSAQVLVKRGLTFVDECFAKPSSPLPCNQVQVLRPGPFSGAATGFSLAQTFAAGIQNAWCVQQPDILANYPAARKGSGTINLVGPQVQLLINGSTTALQGSSLPGRGARRRCIRTIGKVRTKIARQVLAQAVSCQRAIDRNATSFGIISPTCLGPAPKASKRSRTVARACRGLTGADVGSCTPLPDCVIASATQTGHDLAVATYGARPDQQGQLCGNGVVDPGESCDEGPANNPTGACTDACEKAQCGDSKVEAGVEECDPGSQPGSSSPVTDDPDCNSDCKLTRCGDGTKQENPTTRPPEQCDDGNTVAGDGCSPTCQIESVTCPASGTMDVTVRFETSSSTFSSGNVAGIDISVDYPAPVSFPGSQFLPLEDPADPASRIVLLGGPYDLYSVGALITLFDYDTYIRTVVSGGTLPSNGNNGFLIFNFPEIPFERIRFDCPAGTDIPGAGFKCIINGMINQVGGEISTDAQPDCKLTLPH